MHTPDSRNKRRVLSVVFGLAGIGLHVLSMLFRICDQRYVPNVMRPAGVTFIDYVWSAFLVVGAVSSIGSNLYGRRAYGILLLVPICATCGLSGMEAGSLLGNAALIGLLVLESPVLLILTYLGAVGLMCGERLRRKGSCEVCGYDLTGNVSGRCPECGRRITPGDNADAQIVRRGAWHDEGE